MITHTARPKNYYQGLLAIIEKAIERENDAENYYEKCAKIVGDPKLKAFLTELGQNEIQHRVVLEQYLCELEAQLEIDEEMENALK